MATNVNSATVAPLQSSSRTGEVKSDKLVVSRDGSAGGFAKQTNVNISNSVNNMSAILEKISTTQLDASKAMPKQLQQLINNVVQNAFSLEETLGQGVGSALSSERYSVEQLANLNKMFTQLANSSPESLENLGQELQTILEDEGQAELSCRFCGSRQLFEQRELEERLRAARGKHPEKK